MWAKLNTNIYYQTIRSKPYLLLWRPIGRQKFPWLLSIIYIVKSSSEIFTNQYLLVSWHIKQSNSEEWIDWAIQASGIEYSAKSSLVTSCQILSNTSFFMVPSKAWPILTFLCMSDHHKFVSYRLAEVNWLVLLIWTRANKMWKWFNVSSLEWMKILMISCDF